MRKLLTGVLILLVLLLVSIYLFIPSQINILAARNINCPSSATTRYLGQPSTWHEWWPKDELQKANAPFRLQNVEFSWLRTDATIVNIETKYKTSQANTSLNILPADNNTSLLTWQSKLSASANPFKRVSSYFQARHIKAAMVDVMEQAQLFLEKPENVYKMKIEQQKVTDTLLITTSQDFNHAPSTSEVYGLINTLKSHVASNSAEQTNPPMLNVPENDGFFRTQVALPINKSVPETNKFKIKRMVPGKILVAEVKGGPATVQNAFRELENYMNDHRKMSPAIPFFSLVTDRSAQPDTAQWITRLFYPIL